jgi:hypothetical protein
MNEGQSIFREAIISISYLILSFSLGGAVLYTPFGRPIHPYFFESKVGQSRKGHIKQFL